MKNNSPKNSIRDVYIVDGARTPFLKAQSKRGPFAAADLAVYAGRELLACHPFSPKDIDEVVIGCVMPSEEEANIARIVALRLGCGVDTPAWSVQRNCASGMQAVDSAFKDIMLGRHDLVLAGGTEAMSHAPLIYNDQMVAWFGKMMQSKTGMQKIKQILRWRPSFMAPIIALLKGLEDPFTKLSMGQTAENLAFRFGISRQEMDQFALDSHQKVANAWDQDLFGETVTVYDNSGYYYREDTGLRRNSSASQLQSLRPFFDKKFGKVTPGNSSQVTDGAALVLLASAEAVKKFGLKVMGKISAVEWAGCKPEEMGLGPAYASGALLSKNNLSINDIDYWEINEAFSAQVIACQRALADEDFCRDELGLDRAVGQIDPARLNVDGGAIALGHPVGASGARIILHLLKVLKRENAQKGIASICIGGGLGGAMLIENISEVA